MIKIQGAGSVLEVGANQRIKETRRVARVARMRLLKGFVSLRIKEARRVARVARVRMLKGFVSLRIKEARRVARVARLPHVKGFARALGPMSIQVQPTVEVTVVPGSLQDLSVTRVVKVARVKANMSMQGQGGQISLNT